MIGIFHICILLAVTATVILGLGVYITNPKRVVNQQFLAMSMAIVAWQSCQWNALFSTQEEDVVFWICLLYTSPSPRDLSTSRMPSSA